MAVRSCAMPRQVLAFCLTVPHNAPAQMGELMFDTATARRLMVEGQIRTADVTNLDLQEAMLTLPREHFLPQSLAPLASCRHCFSSFSPDFDLLRGGCSAR